MVNIFKQARRIDKISKKYVSQSNSLHDKSQEVRYYVDLQRKVFVGFIGYISFIIGIISFASGILMKKDININIGIIVLFLSSIYIVLSIIKYRHINQQGYTIDKLKNSSEVIEYEEVNKNIEMLEGSGLNWLLFISFLALMAFIVSVWEYVWWLSIGAVIFGIIFLYYWNRNFKEASEYLSSIKTSYEIEI